MPICNINPTPEIFDFTMYAMHSKTGCTNNSSLFAHYVQISVHCLDLTFFQ